VRALLVDLRRERGDRIARHPADQIERPAVVVEGVRHVLRRVIELAGLGEVSLT